MTERVWFACPKCQSKLAYPVGHGMMRCRNCRFTAVTTSFKLERRPGLRWDVSENMPDSDDD